MEEVRLTNLTSPEPFEAIQVCCFFGPLPYGMLTPLPVIMGAAKCNGNSNKESSRLQHDGVYGAFVATSEHEAAHAGPSSLRRSSRLPKHEARRQPRLRRRCRCVASPDCIAALSPNSQEPTLIPTLMSCKGLIKTAVWTRV